MTTHQYVVKRSGLVESLKLDKITTRVRKLCENLNLEYIDPVEITMRVIGGLYPGVTTEQIDIHSADVAASMTYKHSDYAILAGRIAVNNLYKKVEANYSDVCKNLYRLGLITKCFYDLSQKYAKDLDAMLNHKADMNLKYFGFKTLEKGYLLQHKGEIQERPQHMYMRVALFIHGDDIEAVRKTYELLSENYFTHASPTMFAAGTHIPQLSSCFVLGVPRDSIEAIYGTLKDCAQISKCGGGIGINFHNVRARGSPISSTSGASGGLTPALRVFNNMVKHVDQGGKRKGALCAYIEPWHADIFEFLDLKRNMGVEDNKARDLHYAIWCPNLFFKRFEDDDVWSLMCPSECPDLNTSYGVKFEELYNFYEKRGKYIRQIKARDLLKKICEIQIETGGPFMLLKDNCNMKSNQQNLGTIQNSNLCAEIIEYHDADETAVCNLASIAVNKCVREDVIFDMTFNEYKSVYWYDYNKLHEIAKVVTENLNKIIDINYYPLDSAQASNFKHRPVGLGIQGLADVFAMMRVPYDSECAQKVNRYIAETIYHGALEASCELAEKFGPYESYEGSPASQGILQYDMWGVQPTDLWDWSLLKTKIAKHGLRNSQLVAYMPTATTAQILGNNESFEPFTSNLYIRRVLAGEFQVVNEHLVRALVELDLYTPDIINKIMKHRGSVQDIEEIPDNIKAVFKTAWEIKVRTTMDMAAERGAFICQSQSFNVFLAKPTYQVLSTIHRYAWKKGLKTGMYYLRTQPAAEVNQFTVAKINDDDNKNSDDIMTANYCAVGCSSCEG
ncbi:RR1 [Rachiplusia nu nucleopolyhedrovirus]|uniref:Ribonucleoside-diphosphate reductase n=1 Tax=Rachiplusia nu nucleopolyhedrovirus TaxID=2605775 RepID=A0AAF1DB67_9ABAC|nr:RR1 [Rachiplusia nu nucleopolyhedrovirus]QEI03707.1 RR1 [Rachiplusia nu nucleopolyhedrovirus]